MLKLKAYWLRWWHLMYNLIKLKEYHCAYTKGISTLFLGIEIWFNPKKIACTCGKMWYHKNKK